MLDNYDRDMERDTERSGKITNFQLSYGYPYRIAQRMWNSGVIADASTLPADGKVKLGQILKPNVPLNITENDSFIEE
jgi:hypothetical protein